MSHTNANNNNHVSRSYKDEASLEKSSPNKLGKEPVGKRKSDSEDNFYPESLHKYARIKYLEGTEDSQLEFPEQIDENPKKRKMGDEEINLPWDFLFNGSESIKKYERNGEYEFDSENIKDTTAFDPYLEPMPELESDFDTEESDIENKTEDSIPTDIEDQDEEECPCGCGRYIRPSHGIACRCEFEFDRDIRHFIGLDGREYSLCFDAPLGPDQVQFEDEQSLDEKAISFKNIEENYEIRKILPPNASTTILLAMIVLFSQHSI